MSKRVAADITGAGAGSGAAMKRFHSAVGDAADFVQFVNASPSPFHAVAECERRLAAAGFAKLSERDLWSDALKPSGKYYVTRNQSALVAFVVGGKYTPGNAFSMIGAHTDSPCLKLKPVFTRSSHGYCSVGVECYGGGLWHTWFDRDLSVAGRVLVKQADGSVKSTLVRIARPVLRVPSLAIHLDRSVSEGFTYNKETHLLPVLCQEVNKSLLGASDSAPPLVTMLARELTVAPEDIVSLDMCLYDTQPATIGGACDEFIFSARLDNLMMSYTSLQGLIASLDGSEAEDGTVRAIGLFDNEEVGSASLMGAGSTLLEEVVRRVVASNLGPRGEDSVSVTLRRSFLVSADMAHALHPNYAAKHEDKHQPKMNAGIVIKTNANQRYATSAISSFVMKEAASRAGVGVQEFAVRQDAMCGSTIGPILSTSMGLRTVDVGLAQLSMHSIREMCGSADVASCVQLFATFFSEFATIDALITHAD